MNNNMVSTPQTVSEPADGAGAPLTGWVHLSPKHETAHVPIAQGPLSAGTLASASCAMASSAPAWSQLPSGPQRIVCLTEETTEWLYLLGQDRRIVGISGYTVRPKRARQEKPRVSAFTSAKVDKILALQPDCVLGFSDMQADIASALIRAGVPVTVFNQRSVAQIFDMLYQVAAMVGQAAQGLVLIQKMQQELQVIQGLGANFSYKPKIYFEEWDVPQISAIQWVSELIGIAGGEDIFPELAAQSLGKHRIIADGAEVVRRNPDIIIGSWCGKKFRPETVAARAGWDQINAVKHGQLFEIKSCDILQPGPAALTDGLAQLHRIIMAWARVDG